MSKSNDSIYLSVVTPTFNEEATIEKCISAIEKVMRDYDPTIKYEHIIIDNASTDNTVSVALRLAQFNSRIRVALNDSNIGSTRNIYKGLSLTKGEWVVPMLPADLQDPAHIIPVFLQNISPESNVIFGVRKNRQEPILMRALRNIYYRIIRKFSSSNMPLHSGEFCLINRSLVEAVVEIKDENPYVRGLIAQGSKSPKYVEYVWTKREAGVSKATPSVLAEVAITGFVSTSQIPARIALMFGFVISLLSFLIAVFQGALVIFEKRSASPGIPTIIVAVFFFGGVQLLFTGLIGEYVLSMHRQIKRMPAVKTQFLN